MKRIERQIPDEESRAVLERGRTGVLAVHGDDGYPYTVPLNYAFAGDKLYFHCAYTGHKMDAITRDAKVSFCVVDHDEVAAEKFTTKYRSVIAFGRAAVVEDPAEKHAALRLLTDKYSPAVPADAAEQKITAGLARVCVVCITIEHLTGKIGREFLRT
ncbi:MAG: pyridoxamine 5'-phosphate oxidase family protein [Eubacteriales bacterium]